MIWVLVGVVLLGVFWVMLACAAAGGRADRCVEEARARDLGAAPSPASREGVSYISTNVAAPHSGVGGLPPSAGEARARRGELS